GVRSKIRNFEKNNAFLSEIGDNMFKLPSRFIAMAGVKGRPSRGSSDKTGSKKDRWDGSANVRFVWNHGMGGGFDHVVAGRRIGVGDACRVLPAPCRGAEHNRGG